MNVDSSLTINSRNERLEESPVCIIVIRGTERARCVDSVVVYKVIGLVLDREESLWRREQRSYSSHRLTFQ